MMPYQDATLSNQLIIARMCPWIAYNGNVGVERSVNVISREEYNSR